MESFFERMEPWRKPEGALHLYALPDDDETERFMAAGRALLDVEHLPLMPEAYLHATVQRLPQFDDEVSQADLTSLGAALGRLCAELPAFDLYFDRPVADEVAVVCGASASAEWDALVAGCREVVADTWGVAPPAAPAGPHVSLAYATGAVSRELVGQRLAEADPIGTVRVDALHLVSVTVRPERGTFDFTSLANWDLASG